MIVIDLDGCTSDDLWRRRFIKRDERDPDTRYFEYHRRCERDKACNMEMFAGRNDIIVVTTRPNLYRRETLHWLHYNGIRHPLLFMRQLGDHRPSAAVKGEIVARLLHEGHFIHRAYDDRPDVIQAYKELGVLHARVLAIHPGEIE